MLARIESGLRSNSSQYLHLLEALLYVGVGLLLSASAIAAVIRAGSILWRDTAGWTFGTTGYQVLDQLLLVLMLVEILHTVRISIRSQELTVEPFLVVGLIASIRRVLLITMQAAKLTEPGRETPETATAFRNSMIELAVLGLLGMVFVIAIWLLRRSRGESVVGEPAPDRATSS